jgi:hypothetical protein
MKLLDLTPAEVAYLCLPAAVPHDLQSRLSRRLAAMLTARLRLPVRAQVHTGAAPNEAPLSPCWQPDAALVTLWLTRRLGGQRVAGVASFVPPTLMRHLDALLAECWLDAAAPVALPAALACQITTDSTQAMLALQLPRHPTDMTRWAREVIRHG